MLARYHSDFPRLPFKVRGTLIGRPPSSCSDNEEQLRLAYFHSIAQLSNFLTIELLD